MTDDTENTALHFAPEQMSQNHISSHQQNLPQSPIQTNDLHPLANRGKVVFVSSLGWEVGLIFDVLFILHLFSVTVHTVCYHKLLISLFVS